MDTSKKAKWQRAVGSTLRVGLVGLLALLIGITSQHVDWGAMAGAQHKEFENYDKDKHWAGKLRAGGYLLYVRHAQREKWEDVTGFDMVELATQADGLQTSYKKAVCLTDRGIEESKLIGEVFRLAEVKVDKVVSSPSCRARQTAMHAFGRVDAIANSLLHRSAVMRDQHEEFARDLRRIMETLEPKPGSNVVLSAHAGTFRFDKGILIDKDETGDPDGRLETGIVVLEKAGGQLIARHKFLSIRHLANATIKLPLAYKELTPPR
jgi:broad specificity phosphatase PhoE